MYSLVFYILSFALASTSYAVSYNNKYLKTGKITIATSTSFYNLTAADWNPLTYTVNYADSFPNITKSSAVIATDDIHIYLRSGEQIEFSGAVSSLTLTNI